MLVLFGDTPLLTAETIQICCQYAVRHTIRPSSCSASDQHDPAEYGRLITGADGALEAIVEVKDASHEQRKIGLCNAGVMAIDSAHLLPLLDGIGNDNANGEYYLTDIVKIARARDLACAVVEAADPVEVMGVNSRAQLAKAEAAMQDRLRQAAMAAGVTMTDPGTVWLSADTQSAKMSPSDRTFSSVPAFQSPTTSKSNRSAISNKPTWPPVRSSDRSHGCGPARTSKKTSKLVTFVEIKAARLNEGAKVNHLTYIGDARIGSKANIGAGTITCNYDGFSSITRTSARARSSDRTRRWWRRLRLATVPSLARAR